MSEPTADPSADPSAEPTADPTAEPTAEPTDERRARRDGGFSLVEVVVCIGLVAILAPVIAGAFSVALRTSPGTQDAIDDARTLQGVVTWLPQDVDSTPPSGFDTAPGTPSGCTLNPGTNLLRLEWTENIGAGDVRFVANYRHVLVDGTYVIQRVSCNGTGAGPLGNARALGASSPLTPLPDGWTEGQLPFRITVARDASGDVELVTFEVQTLSGKIIRTDSAPKNPANTLPPTTTEVPPVLVATTTTPPTTTAPTTTGPTTTLPGPTTTAGTTTTTSTTLPPCTVLTASLTPGSVRNTDPNGNGKSSANVGVLADPVTLTVTTGGGCTGLEARATTGAPNGELFRNFSSVAGSTTNWSVTFPGYPQGSSELWADGMRTIRIFDATGGPYWTGQLEVR